MTRTVDYQLKISERALDSYIKKLQTSLNNLNAKRGHTEYIRYRHVADDCLTVLLAIESHQLLQMMRDSTDLEGYG